MRKFGVLTLLLAGVLTLGATAARGQGGACPSGANYLNVSSAATQPSLATQPLVTLASLGVKSCFYISAAGSDTNSGTSEASPWQHAPGMPNCASGTACHITPVAGEGFILRGGDTWHYFTGSPQVGLPSGWPTGANSYAWNWIWSGTSTAEIYIGVDPGWFSGSAWSRPIFNNDNPTFLPTAPSPAQTTAGWASTAVSSCAFPNGSLSDIVLNGVSYVQLDNFEFTGLCWNNIPSNGGNGTMEETYIKHFGVGSQAVSWRRITNMYWHGWSHTAFNASCSPGPPNPGSTCGSATAMIGTTQSAAQGSLMAFDVCDGSDSDDLSFSCTGIGDGYDWEESVMRHVGPVNILGNCHELHDNLFEFINNAAIPGAHSDMWFCVSEFASNNFYYNNLIRNVGTEYNQPSLSTVVWFGGVQPGNTCGGVCTDYIFNNVIHDVNAQGNYMNVGGTATGIGNGGVVAFNMYNNTVEMLPIIGGGGSTSPVWENGSAGSLSYTSQNNHYITNATPGCAAAFVSTTHVNVGVTSCAGDVFQTISAANGQGYTSANDFQPISGTNATVGAGANESSLVPAFGSAFAGTTTNACSYITGNHTISCPEIAAVLRPTSGACPGSGCWNAGAFNFTPSSVTLVPAGYTFAATAIGNNSGDSPVTFTLTNNTGVTITSVAISFTGANAGDFSNTTSCGSTLAGGANCRIFVTFRPTATGTRTATLTVSDSDASSPQTSSLSGTATPSVINPSPANPVTFGVVVTDPSIPSTVKNEKHSENVSAHNLDRVVLAGFLH